MLPVELCVTDQESYGIFIAEDVVYILLFAFSVSLRVIYLRHRLTLYWIGQPWIIHVYGSKLWASIYVVEQLQYFKHSDNDGKPNYIGCFINIRTRFFIKITVCVGTLNYSI